MNVFIVDPDLPLSEDKPLFGSQTDFGPIKGFELNALPQGHLFAILSDKETVYGQYDSPGDAAKADGNPGDNRYIRRYINLERLVTLTNGIPVYFVMNPEWFTNPLRNAPRTPHRVQPVVVIDTLAPTHTAIQFDTVRDLLAWLGLSRSS
jgi:hypothetical protein